jgi:hypothetical protein
MDKLFGVVFLAVGLALLMGSRPLAEATTRANAAFTRGRAFAGRGWTVYGRVVYCVVGAGCTVVGGGLALGLMEFD